MAKLVLDGRMRVRAALFASIALLLDSWLHPAVAEQSSPGRQTVEVIQVDAIGGQVFPVTVMCPLDGTCAARAHLTIRGQHYEYSLIVSAARERARISLLFLRKDSTTPRLSLGQNESMDVELQPDGTGSRTAAITALGSGYRYPGFSPSAPARTPVANVRVTVRREDAAEQNR